MTMGSFYNNNQKYSKIMLYLPMISGMGLQRAGKSDLSPPHCIPRESDRY
jgi:hypothetical protein